MLDWWYDLVQMILPFTWANHLFMKNALLAILLVSPLFGILGTMIVNNRMVFFSDALGHGAFTGIALGGILGIIKPMGSAVIFATLFAIIVVVVKNSSKSSTDTIIGVFSAAAMAGGIVLASFGGNSFNKYSSYLIGDLLSITPEDIYMLMAVSIVVIILWLFLFNKVLLVSVHRSLAGSRGINTLLVELVFTAVIAVLVTLSIPWVGLLIINSLLVLPAAAARNITVNMRQYHLASVVLALVSGVTGLILSYYWNTATGATIVLVATFLFIVTFALRSKVA